MLLSSVLSYQAALQPSQSRRCSKLWAAFGVCQWIPKRVRQLPRAQSEVHVGAFQIDRENKPCAGIVRKPEWQAAGAVRSLGSGACILLLQLVLMALRAGCGAGEGRGLCRKEICCRQPAMRVQPSSGGLAVLPQYYLALLLWC